MIDLPFLLPFGSDQSRGKARLASVDLPRRDRKPVIESPSSNWLLSGENHFFSISPYLLKTFATKGHFKKFWRLSQEEFYIFHRRTNVHLVRVWAFKIITRSIFSVPWTSYFDMNSQREGRKMRAHCYESIDHHIVKMSNDLPAMSRLSSFFFVLSFALISKAPFQSTCEFLRATSLPLGPLILSI